MSSASKPIHKSLTKVFSHICFTKTLPFWSLAAASQSISVYPIYRFLELPLAFECKFLVKSNTSLVYTRLSCQFPMMVSACSFYIFSKKSLLQKFFKNNTLLIREENCLYKKVKC